jgi:spore photoproduct lyase
MGFWIGIHFDPMVWYDRWRVDYETVVERIFSCISNPERIAWWSLGGFRTMPALKSRLRALGRHLPLFAGEMVPGADKKLRYFRQVRTGFYTAMREKIERFYPECTLYLCMESREVWEEAGLLSRIPAGLTGFLDTRAEQMLAAGRGMK